MFRSGLNLTPDPSLLARFSASAPKFIEETAAAIIWNVRLEDGRQAALKYYPNGPGNEAQGIDYLASINGKGAAKLYDKTKEAILLEWLEGPSLGDLSRQGDDVRANAELLHVLQHLHKADGPRALSLPRLDDWFKALFEVEFHTECPCELRRTTTHAQSLARDLLSSQQDIAPLHGDLHHDNIRYSPRGWLAFDAKGVCGERGYELANAFRNPKGASELVHSPDRVRHLAETWATPLGLSKQRLLSWAAAKCALSIVWRSKGTLRDDAEGALLSLLLKLSESEI